MRGTRLAWWVVFIIGALYFFVPLIATFVYSLGNPIGPSAPPPSFEYYGTVLSSSNFWESLGYSFIIGIITIIVSIGLLMPTAYWVRLRVPRARPLVEFITLLPFVIPPIILVFGLHPDVQPRTAAADPHRHGQQHPAGRGLHRPVVPVHVPRGRHRPPGDRHPEPDRGRPEPGCRLDADHPAGHPAEPAGGAAERRVPDPGHRHRRVHHRLVPGPAGVRPIPEPARHERGLRAGRRHHHQLRIDLAGDDHDRLHRPGRAHAASPSPARARRFGRHDGVPDPDQRAEDVPGRWRRRRPGLQPRRRARRVRVVPRPVGLRQDHDPADDRGLRAADLGHDHGRRQGHHQQAAEPAQRRDGLPVVRAVPEHDRRRQHRLRAQGPQEAEGRHRQAGRPSCSGSSTSRIAAGATRGSCPAASSSASRSPARSPSSPRSCSSTSRCPRSTPRSGSSCARRSGPSSASSGSRPCTSPTTRRRRSRCRTAWWS